MTIQFKEKSFFCGNAFGQKGQPGATQFAIHGCHELWKIVDDYDVYRFFHIHCAWRTL